MASRTSLVLLVLLACGCGPSDHALAPDLRVEGAPVLVFKGADQDHVSRALTRHLDAFRADFGEPYPSETIVVADLIRVWDPSALIWDYLGGYTTNTHGQIFVWYGDYGECSSYYHELYHAKFGDMDHRGPVWPAIYEKCRELTEALREEFAHDPFGDGSPGMQR